MEGLEELTNALSNGIPDPIGLRGLLFLKIGGS